ncbi:MAG: hypothetical protein E4H13_14200 [Calditrichales bacterium]|nr:MAG: hypothetical protein E4H13_14200 [Calditrichales bacterium]
MWKPLFSVFSKDKLIDKAFEDSAKMLKLTEKMFHESKKGLREQDPEKILIDIYDADKKVNKFERKVRKEVLKDLAENGQDLYSGFLLVSIIVDIERIGDYAKNMLDLAKNYHEKLQCKSMEKDIVRLEAAIEDTFARVRKHFELADKDDAEKLLGEYLWVNQVCDKLTASMIRGEDKSLPPSHAAAMALYVRYLKRINSHLRNVASSIVNPFDHISFNPQHHRHKKADN